MRILAVSLIATLASVSIPASAEDVFPQITKVACEALASQKKIEYYRSDAHLRHLEVGRLKTEVIPDIARKIRETVRGIRDSFTAEEVESLRRSYLNPKNAPGYGPASMEENSFAHDLITRKIKAFQPAFDYAACGGNTAGSWSGAGSSTPEAHCKGLIFHYDSELISYRYVRPVFSYYIHQVPESLTNFAGMKFCLGLKGAPERCYIVPLASHFRRVLRDWDSSSQTSFIAQGIPASNGGPVMMEDFKELPNDEALARDLASNLRSESEKDYVFARINPDCRALLMPSIRAVAQSEDRTGKLQASESPAFSEPSRASRSSSAGLGE